MEGIRYSCGEIAWLVNLLAGTLSAELDEKVILITSLADYSRTLLSADCVKAEIRWAHIQACPILYEASHRYDYA